MKRLTFICGALLGAFLALNADAALFLKQSTASQAVVLGPFVDSTDGDTEETALTIANTDVHLSKNGGTIASKNSGGCTHDANGFYTCTFDATDTGTVGRLQVYVHVSGALPVTQDFEVLPANVYDSLVGGTDTLQADLTQIGGSAVSTSTAQLGVNVVNVGGTAQTANDNGADINAILTDTAEIGTAGAGLTNITLAHLAAGAVADLFDTDSGTTYPSAVAGSAVKEIADNAGGSALTAASILAGQGGHTTTIATLASQTSFTLTAGSADDNAYNGFGLVVVDSATSTQQALGCVSDYTGSTKTVTLQADPGIFTMAAGDNVILLPAYCTSGVDVTSWNGVALATTNPLPNAAPDAAGGLVISDAGGLDIDTLDSNVSAILTDTGTTLPGVLGTPTDLGGGATLADNAADMAGATFSSSTDSQEAIRNRGDAAWTTGAGGDVPQLLNNTTIATLASQTSFTLTAGSADDDAYNNSIIVVTDQSTSTQIAFGTISDYVGSTKTVTLSADPAIFTMAVGDTVDIIAPLGSATGDATAANQTTILNRLTATRAGYLDNLSAGATALESTAQSILTDTAEIGAAGAGLTEAGGTGDQLTALATQASVDTVDGNVDAILVDTGTTLPAVLGTPAGADLATDIANVPTAAENSAQVLSDQGVLTGTCSSGSTTTCVDNALTQAATSQLDDRLICFDDDWCALITDFTPGTDTVTTTKTAPTTRASKAYTIYPATAQ